jgi:hypothetical protein
MVTNHFTTQLEPADEFYNIRAKYDLLVMCTSRPEFMLFGNFGINSIPFGCWPRAWNAVSGQFSVEKFS